MSMLKLIKENIKEFIIFGLIICFFLLFNIAKKLDKKRLKENAIFQNNAVLINFINSQKTISKEYSFWYNGKYFVTKDMNGISKKINISSLFKQKYFPVIFQKQHPYNARLLIDSSNFKDFNLTFPDSLAWLYK